MFVHTAPWDETAVFVPYPRWEKAVVFARAPHYKPPKNKATILARAHLHGVRLRNLQAHAMSPWDEGAMFAPHALAHLPPWNEPAIFARAPLG